jgi:hypothetical protein
MKIHISRLEIFLNYFLYCIPTLEIPGRNFIFTHRSRFLFEDQSLFQENTRVDEDLKIQCNIYFHVLNPHFRAKD